MKKKKGSKKILSGLFTLIAIALLYEGVVWVFSDRIVKLSFNGLENMFTVHDEYFAVAGPLVAPVPKVLVQTVCEEDVENIGRLDDETGKSFFVQANYNLDSRPVFDGTTTLTHDYSDKYVFEVTSPGPGQCIVSSEEEQIMLEIAEYFYDFNDEYVRGEDNWVARTGQSTTMFSYRMFMDGDKVVFVLHQPKTSDKVYTYDDGNITKILSVSQKGDFDLVIWKQRIFDMFTE